MVTGNTIHIYVDLSCKIFSMYLYDTIIDILDFMSTDEAVLEMEQILSTDPSEDELLDRIQALQQADEEL